jgi:hypothetical protein
MPPALPGDGYIFRWSAAIHRLPTCGSKKTMGNKSLRQPRLLNGTCGDLILDDLFGLDSLVDCLEQPFGVDYGKGDHAILIANDHVLHPQQGMRNWFWTMERGERIGNASCHGAVSEAPGAANRDRFEPVSAQRRGGLCPGGTASAGS